MSKARMWKRKSNETYYVTLSDKQIPLGKDERKAQQECNRLVPPEANGDIDDVRGVD